MSDQLFKGPGDGIMEWREDFVLTDEDGADLFRVERATGNVTAAGTITGSGPGTTPGGPNNSVQFNSAGTFAGDADLFFDSGSSTLNTINLNVDNIDTDAANVLVISVPQFVRIGGGSAFADIFSLDASDLRISGEPNGAIGKGVTILAQSDSGFKTGFRFTNVTGGGIQPDVELVPLDAGTVVIGGGLSDPSSVLTINGQAPTLKKGFLPPRLTTAERDSIAAPAEGLVCYNTTTQVLNFYNGTVWAAV